MLLPSSSATTVNVFPDHCAYNVAFAVNGYEAEFAYGVPEPFAAVFHPAKVYPARVNAFAVRFVADDDVCADIEPLPPLPSNVTGTEEREADGDEQPAPERNRIPITV